jgi:hypothetical protein
MAGAFTFSYTDDALDEAAPGVEYDPDTAHDDVLMDMMDLPSPVIGKGKGRERKRGSKAKVVGKRKTGKTGQAIAAAAGGGGDADDADEVEEAPATKKPRGPGRCALVVARVGEEFQRMAEGGSEARFWKQTCLVLADHFLAPHLEPPKHPKRKSMEHMVKALHKVSKAVRHDAIAALSDDVQRHIVQDRSQNPFETV